LIAAFCGLCFTQNFVLVMALDHLWQPQTVAALLVVALYKSAPLILFTLLVWRHGRGLAAIYEAPSPKVEMSLSV
jgi:hypothetical protein